MVISSFASFFNSGSLGLRVFLFGIIITIVSVFIWYFYESISKRNLIKLDLKKYNQADNPLPKKLVAILLYFVEYIVVIPILILIWFTALSVVFLLISSNLNIIDVLVLSAAIVISIRILAYYNSEISRDLAKMFPFTALSFFLLKSHSLDLSKMISGYSQLPSLLGSILLFFLIVIGIEVILRLFYTLFEFWDSEDSNPHAQVSPESDDVEVSFK